MTNDCSGGLRGLRPRAIFWQPFWLRLSVNYFNAEILLGLSVGFSERGKGTQLHAESSKKSNPDFRKWDCLIPQVKLSRHHRQPSQTTQNSPIKEIIGDFAGC